MQLFKKIIMFGIIATAMIFLAIFSYSFAIGALGLTINQGAWIASLVVGMVAFALSYRYLKSRQQAVNLNTNSEQDRLLPQEVHLAPRSIFSPIYKFFCTENIKQDLIKKINQRREEYFIDELKYHQDIVAINKIRVDLIERRQAENELLRQELERLTKNLPKDKIVASEPLSTTKVIDERQKEIARARDKIEDLVSYRDSFTIDLRINLSTLSKESLSGLLNQVTYAISQRQDLHRIILQEKHNYMRLLDNLHESAKHHLEAKPRQVV